ncbi:MAG: hypothetical protein ACQERS_10505 [Bacteroidota bacterium]
MNKPLRIADKAIIRKNSKILLLQQSHTSGFDHFYGVANEILYRTNQGFRKIKRRE